MVIADAPLTFAEAGDTKGSWVQVAKQGKFKDPRYGEFSITQKDYDAWLRNFDALSKAGGRLGLPVDVDHAPEKKGETEAAGWITKLEQRGNDLWGFVEWTSLGAELVGDRRYAYISPSYAHNYKDEQGREHGTALVGVALTNRPFLNMATVNLSAVEFAAAEEVAESASDSPGQMALLDDLRKSLGLADDADEATVLAAATDAKAKADAAPAADQGDTKTLDELAKDEGKVVLSADDARTLLSDAAAGKAAAEELRIGKFETAFDKALEQGAATPAMKDGLRKLYDLDGETTLSQIEALQPVVNTAARGGSGGTALSGGHKLEERETLDEDRADLDVRAQQLAAEHKISYTDAVMLAAQEA